MIKSKAISKLISYFNDKDTYLYYNEFEDLHNNGLTLKLLKTKYKDLPIEWVLEMYK